MVSPIVAIKNGIRYCITCDVKGRSPRSEFLWFWLFLLIAAYIIQTLALGLISSLTVNDIVISASALLLFAISTYCHAIILIRRFHDHDISGYIICPLYIIICIDRLVGEIYLEITRNLIGTPYTLQIPQFAKIAGVVFLIIGVISAIAMLFGCLSRGTVGPNRYGPDPLAPAASDSNTSNISQQN